MIKIVLLVMVAAICSYLAYEIARINSLIITGKSLARTAKAFQRAEGARSMLVLGDSTAVGVGAEPEISVAGRLSNLFDASVENHANIGATTDDVGGQLKRAERERYDFILIQVGANDIIHFRSLRSAEESLRAILDRTRPLSSRVILLTGGRIGDAPFFPHVARPIMNWRTAALRERFMRVADEYDVVYVDIFSRTDHFKQNIKKYYSEDLLHLSDEGYGFWSGIVREYVEKKWPELIDSEVSKVGA